MKIYETVCFAICAATRCTIADLEGLYTEAVQLATMIKRNFEELGI